MPRHRRATAAVSAATRLKEAVPLGVRKSVKARRAATFEHFGSHRFSMPALYGLDAQMVSRLPTNGVFLEVGANDGYSQSNTYYLDRVLGWRGILIEPHPDLYARCRRVRRTAACYNVACTESSGGLVELADMDLMSVTLGQQSAAAEAGRLQRSVRTFAVAAMAVSDVIDDSPFASVDFMSVDVEGAELALLRGLDLDRHCPGWLLVETEDPGAVAALVGSHMRAVEQLSYHDYLWERTPPVG